MTEGEIYTFKGTRRPIKIIYNAESAFRIKKVGKIWVLFEPVTMRAFGGEVFRQEVAKLKTTVELYWYKHTEEEILAAEVLYGRNTSS